MNAYRRGWLFATTTLILFGTFTGAAQSPHILAILSAAFSVAGATVALLVSRANSPRGRRKGTARGILLGAAVTGSSAGAFAGLTMIIGAWAVIVAVVVVAASPRVIDASRRWLRTKPSPLDWQLDTILWSFAYSGPVYLPFQPPPGAQCVSDDQLLSRAWCASYRALKTTTSRRQRMRIVEERSEYLDELERRNPAAFSSWLASAATAADSPLTYLTEGLVSPSAIDWDSLLDGQDDR